MPAPRRVIAHIDMDAFYAAIEARDRPACRGRPLVVGAPPDGRGVVAAASYEARRYGIRSAMPSREAFARCPEALFLPPDMPRYRAVSRQLFEVLEAFTPQIEPLSIDEAFLDLTGTPAARGTGAGPGAGRGAGGAAPAPLALARAIQARIRETLRLPVSVGVAPNKFLAKLASELAKPDGVREIRAEEAAAVLAPLPVTVLWGVGAKTHERLARLGIRTVGDVQRTPTSALRASLGFAAEHLAQLSRGVDHRPVEAGRETKSVGRETTFEQDVADPAALRRTLGALAEDVAAALRGERLQGRTITLKLRYADFRTLTRSLTLPAGTSSGAAVFRAASALLGRLGALPQPVRLIGVSVSALGSADRSQGALFGPEETQARVDEVRDAINERFGEGTLRAARDAGDRDPAAG
jgi:DNA polymerase-4